MLYVNKSQYGKKKQVLWLLDLLQVRTLNVGAVLFHNLEVCAEVSLLCENAWSYLSSFLTVGYTLIKNKA